MTVGVSVGDVIAAVTLAAQLWTCCFSKVGNAQIAYTRYGEQISGLRDSLYSLWQILSEHENRLRAQRGQQFKVDSVDLNALAIIIGDFEGTLKRTNKLMEKYAIFKKDPNCPHPRGYVTRIRWSIDAEAEVLKLTQECSFHMVKIQFVMEPLKLKLQMDLGEQIQETRDELVERLQRIEGLLRPTPHSSNLAELPAGLNIVAGLPEAPEQTQVDTQDDTQGGGNVQHLLGRRLGDRFEDKLRYHPKFGDIPIEEWTEAAAWWIKMGTAPLREQAMFGLATVPADLYINLLKAAWLLSRCEESLVYRRLERNSLWRIHICGLTQTIEGELRGITERGLSIPDEEALLRLPESCFTIWLKYAETETVTGTRDERPGEEKILELTLETTLNPDRFAKELLIFRKDEGTLRVCITTEDFSDGSRSSEVFIMKPAEAQLLALYITQYNPFQSQPPLNVIMNNQHQSGELSFKSIKDLKAFQRAIVGAQVIFDQPGSRSLLCAPTFVSALEGTNVRVQIWLDKPLSKLSPPSASPNPDASPDGFQGSPFSPALDSISTFSAPPPTPIPTMTRTMTSVTSYSTSSSCSSSGSGLTREVIEFRVPTAPRLMVYFKARNQWKILQILMEDALIIKPKHCCGNHMKRLFAGPGETCCRRTVLEARKGNVEGLLFSPKKDEPECSLDVLQAGLARAKKNGDKMAFKYITIEFLDETEKMRFNRAFDEAKKLGKAHTARVNVQMREAKKQAFVANFGRGGSISRVSTWATSDGGASVGRTSLV